MKIYLACSFAYEDKNKTYERKCFMEKAEKILQDKGFDVYNPSKLKIENAWDYSMWDWGNLVYEADKKAVNESDLLVYLSFGKENSDGSVWEDGYAAGINKKVILVSMNPNSPESLMSVHSAYACLDGLDDLLNYDFNKMPRTRIKRVES